MATTEPVRRPFTSRDVLNMADALQLKSFDWPLNARSKDTYIDSHSKRYAHLLNTVGTTALGLNKIPRTVAGPGVKSRRFRGEQGATPLGDGTDNGAKTRLVTRLQTQLLTRLPTQLLTRLLLVFAFGLRLLAVFARGARLFLLRLREHETALGGGGLRRRSRALKGRAVCMLFARDRKPTGAENQRRHRNTIDKPFHLTLHDSRISVRSWRTVAAGGVF